MTKEVALSALDDSGKERLTEGDFQMISAVLLYYAISLPDLCSASPAPLSTLPGSHQFYLRALASLHPDEDPLFLSASETESILQRVNQHYHPTKRNNSPEQKVPLLFWDPIYLTNCEAIVNISQLMPSSASILPTSLRTSGCKRILVPLCRLCLG